MHVEKIYKENLLSVKIFLATPSGIQPCDVPYHTYELDNKK
jgi:hypothetical protein